MPPMGTPPSLYLQRVPHPDAQLLRVPGLELVQRSRHLLRGDGGPGDGGGDMSTREDQVLPPSHTMG